VRRILESRRVALEAVTRRLIESEVIDGAELRQLVETSIAAPQIVPGTDAERSVPRGAPADPAHGRDRLHPKPPAEAGG
jgi:cell division protease FtsH